MPLTPEQQALQKLARQAAAFADDATDPRCRDFVDGCGPHEVLALLAQLEGCNEDYGSAVDSVAQLQDEVFEVRAQLEAREAPKLVLALPTTKRAGL